MINVSGRDEREPYRRGIVEDRVSKCFVCDGVCGRYDPSGARESAEDAEGVGGSESSVSAKVTHTILSADMSCYLQCCS